MFMTVRIIRPRRMRWEGGRDMWHVACGKRAMHTKLSENLKGRDHLRDILKHVLNKWDCEVVGRILAV
jgi:hypothetical protein